VGARLPMLTVLCRLAPRPPMRAAAGGSDFDAAAEYITQRFVELNRSPDKKSIYPHLTCATDTENIRFVWAAVNDIVTRTALRKAGLM